MIVTNMLFFGILNIPLFKYFCDVPTFNALSAIDEDLFFYKNYFLSVGDTSLFNSIFFTFSIDLNFIFLCFNDLYFFIFFFFLTIYL